MLESTYAWGPNPGEDYIGYWLGPSGITPQGQYTWLDGDNDEYFRYGLTWDVTVGMSWCH